MSDIFLNVDVSASESRRDPRFLIIGKEVTRESHIEDSLLFFQWMLSPILLFCLKMLGLALILGVGNISLGICERV